MKETVELHDAFFFICPGCGKTGWVKALHAEMSDDEVAELLATHGPGCMMLAPNSVTCPHCEKEFDAILEGEDEDEEDGEEDDEEDECSF